MTTPGARARRTSLTIAALALTAAGLTACGGGTNAADAPTDASKDEFCSAYTDFLKDISDDSEKVDVGKIKDTADELAALGTPSGTPKDARAGFEASIKTIQDLPDDADDDDLEKADSEFSDDDQANSEAFGAYLAKTCPDLASELGG